MRAKVSEAQNHYVQQAQMAQALVARLAGLRSPRRCWSCPAKTLRLMSQSRPAAAGAQHDCWPAKPVAAKAVPRTARPAKALQQSFARCWGVLGQKGIDKPKLQHIFDSVSKDHGIPRIVSHLHDPAVVL